MRGVLRFLALSLAAVAALAVVGLLVAALADTPARGAVAWTLWICGGVIALVAAGGGSPSENLLSSRQVVGGRFTSSPPLPTSPLQYALLGILCIGVGALVFAAG